MDPQAITRHGFFEVTGNNALVALPVSLAFALGAPALGVSPGATFGLSFLASFGWVSVASNMFHRWAHMREVPRLVDRCSGPESSFPLAIMGGITGPLMIETTVSPRAG